MIGQACSKQTATEKPDVGGANAGACRLPGWQAYKPKPVYRYTSEEEGDFTPCHARFGLFEFYDAKQQLAGHGTIALPNGLLPLQC